MNSILQLKLVSYNTILLPVRFRLKQTVCTCLGKLHNLPGDCARELFIPSKDTASLQDCNEKKKFLVLDFL